MMIERRRLDRLRKTLIEFVRDDSAQDLVEYALLAAFFAIAGMLALNALSSTLGSAYSSWLDPTAGVPSLWEPAAPVVSSGS